MSKKQISYPSRIEKKLINQVNVKRKKIGISWPELTRRFLNSFLKDG